MNRKLWIAPLAAGALFMGTAGSALAAPPETTNGFVCPVIGGQGGVNAMSHGNGPFVNIGGGDISIIGPDVTVPLHATNDDGAGAPGGAHASPGDPGYSAIWSGS